MENLLEIAMISMIWRGHDFSSEDGRKGGREILSPSGIACSKLMIYMFDMSVGGPIREHQDWPGGVSWSRVYRCHGCRQGIRSS